MVVGRLLSLVRRRGTHCQNVYVTHPLVLLFSAVFTNQSTSVSSAVQALATMVYINLRFTLHYIEGKFRSMYLLLAGVIARLRQFQCGVRGGDTECRL